MMNTLPMPEKPRRVLRIGAYLAAISLTVSLIGCASLPDLSGYTAATDQLRQSVKSASDLVTTEIDLVSFAFKESGGDDATVKKLHDAKNNFQKHWEYRNKSMTAIVGYAGSLEEIASAGKVGKESAKALGDSVEGLLKTIGIVPGTQLVGVTKETIVFIYAEVAKVKAQDALDKSLQKTGPIMEEVIKVIEKDSKAMKNSFEIALNAQISQLRRNNEPVRVGGERDDLVKLRTNRNKALVKELTHPDPNKHSRIIKDLTQDISVIEKRLVILNPEWIAYNGELKQLQKRKRLGLGLIQASAKALGAWKSAHVKLAKAIKHKEIA